MTKTKEELESLKKEYLSLSEKLKELSEEELELVVGGVNPEEHNVMLVDE